MSQLISVVVCFYLAVIVRGNILVYRNMSNKFLQEFYDIPAQFGPPIPSSGLRVFSVAASETLGCKALRPPPETFNKYAVIIQRGGENCSFEKKIRNAQAANYDAVIIFNYNNNDDLEPMSAQNATGINIPAVFVAFSTGMNLLGAYSDGNSVLVINDDLPFNINTQLILPFSILIGLCFLIMIFYMIYKCVREERRLRRHRLPKNMLKKLKITKFTKGQPYEMCVICLDEFVEDDRLRVLPCAHAYHSHCIDPWLTKNKRVCPICKRKVFAKGVSRPSRRGFPSSDRPLLGRRQSAADSMTDSDDDTTPLLHPADNATTNNHGTFSSGGDGDVPAVSTDADNQTSDDENVLLSNASPSHGSSRVNPFDRQPNLPPNLATSENTRRSIWDLPIFRSFRRRSNVISIAAPAMTTRNSTVPRSRSEPNTTAVNVPDAVQASGSQPTSNNILNPNLSGSFKDDDDIETHQTIYEPLVMETPPSAAAAASSSDLAGVIIMGSNNNNPQQPQAEQHDSIFIQTPSQGGIGVVALPNTNLRDPHHHRNSSQLPPNRQYFI